ncbi:MAG: radical SAM protein [Deltaproteobacteria bacterium]|nr:radical SAM protein [Deltaproteobacteria bacterium]
MFNFRFGRGLATAEKSYDFPPFRPPSEAESLLLRMTRGCPWNRCAFCPMYRGIRFEVRESEAVRRDIDTAKEVLNEPVETVFVGDSDSLVANTHTWCDILASLYEAFPSITRVTTYARAYTLKRRSLEGLKKIRRAGLTRLHIGLETGNALVLKKVRKGATPATMIQGCHQAKEAGFEVSVYVLVGIGGRSLWREHALETASVLNAIEPDFIRVRTLIPQPGTALYRWWKAGTFELPAPELALKEQRVLIESLKVNAYYLSDHVSNYAPVHGRLPGNRSDMLKVIQDITDRLRGDENFRQCIKKRSKHIYL